MVQDSEKSRKLRGADRLQRILLTLRANSTIRLNELADEFGVSSETIRRDLDKLSSQGLINRTHGGASVVPLGTDPTLKQRLEMNKAERAAIAREAMNLVSPGEVLMISSGVTAFGFAQRLATSAIDVTVLTPSVNVATTLSSNPATRVLLMPGEYYPGEATVVGQETTNFVSRFRANTVFIGASGLTEEGAFESIPGITWNLRAMMERSERVVLLTDHTKFGMRRLDLVCPLDDIDVIVTDRQPEGDLHNAIRRAGVELRIALVAGDDEAGLAAAVSN
ncbi:MULTISPECIES: DeoR/GlpR family DNA-binding transcription regulator [unclassified Hyphomicrobium]|uniref:DeoR/GlpR family DNA-binding transcription regulator n=1 Tax=unclassified Hyphomicrobium TaxID=2619925 RepID=UPI000213E6CA|nr:MULTISPECIES: DeoR/GlpR family DNA-binding transcription regulator [unclassified Hyphomicrobium]CCB67138.1 putative glycerol-3-phosphate regulon repressor [Hyphomicrobium sp. MC1]